MTRITAVAGLVVATAAFGQSSAQAATSIGSGKALIRIDASTAKVAKNSDGTYTLTLPTNSAGQWMGDRTNAKGVKRVLVGNVSAQQLSSKWSNFRYPSSGVKATLAWNAKSANWSSAPVLIAKPVVTKSGVTFKITTKRSLPSSLKNASLNIQRAAGLTGRDYDPSSDTVLTEDLHWFAGYNGSGVYVKMYNSTNNNTCYSHTFDNWPQTATLPSGRCDDVAYTSNSSGNSTASWKEEENSDGMTNGNTESNVWLYLTPDGQSEFQFAQTMLTVSGW
ncbi:MAG: hypothetical protein ACKOAF_07055 [Actinomycetes bacterium]